MEESIQQGGTTNAPMLPSSFCRKMKELLAEDEFLAFLFSYGQKRRYSLRINPLKADPEKALRLLQKAVADGSGTGENVVTNTGTDIKNDDCSQINKLKAVPWESDGFYYPEVFRPGRLPWHEAGMYYIQEASAMVPAMLCGVQPGERVLDLCAAPGGKSTKLAASLRGKGILVANEIHPERAKVLSANLERMGVRNALVTNETPQKLASRFPLYFDRVVVDAPCSGEGMFRKDEEALKQWSLENVRMCAERQAQILEEAASMLRPGGVMVYSTCTFSPEENEGVIYHFLMTHPEFSVINISDMPGIKAKEWGFACGRPEWIPDSERKEENSPEDITGEKSKNALQQIQGTVRLWPQLLEGEGHFAAVLRKDGPLSKEDRVQGREEEHEDGTDPYRTEYKTGYEKISRKKWKGKGKNKGQNRGKQHGDMSIQETMDIWEEFCRDNLPFSDAPDAVTAIDPDRLHMFGNKLFALPVPVSQLSLSGLRVLRAGLELGSVIRGRFEPSHALAMALRKEEVCRYLELKGDSPIAYAWLRGEAVNLDKNAEKGWTLVQFDGCSAGWGKASNGILKNHYPKGIRKGSNYRTE